MTDPRLELSDTFAKMVAEHHGVESLLAIAVLS